MAKISIQLYRVIKFIISYRICDISTIIKDIYYCFKSSTFLYISDRKEGDRQTFIKSVLNVQFEITAIDNEVN